MKHTCETIVDDNGIELTVGYDYEITPSQVEECHGLHDVGNFIYTELQTVELIINHIGIDVLPILTPMQKDYIISLLNYDK